MKKYYEAYDERYKTIHAKGYRWAGTERSPIVMDTIKKHHIAAASPALEIGCGEGRDAIFLLNRGFNLLAIDVSSEAISYCKKIYPSFEDRFQVMDCLKSYDSGLYEFIYSVAVIHMLLLDDDRKAFYQFVHNHLSESGLALICTMGDGQSEMMSDIHDAFILQKRNHPSGKVMVPGTSLRMVSFPHFESELSESGLQIVEKGVTSCLPEFDELMYAIVRRI